MGSFYMNDAVTGETITDGERIVALVLSLYSEERPTSKHATVSPTQLFQITSLPIRGTYDDYGRILPDDDQESVSFLIDILNARDWKDFEYRGIRETEKGNPIHYKDTQDETTPSFSMAYFKESTWANIIGTWLDIVKTERPKHINCEINQIEYFSDMIVDTQERFDEIKTNDLEPLKNLEYSSLLCNLHLLERNYTLKDGRTVSLSGSLSAFATLADVNELFNTNFSSNVSKKYFEIKTFDNMVRPNKDDVKKSLFLCQETIQFLCGLDSIGHHLVPSRYGGQLENHDRIAKLSIGTLEESLGELILSMENLGIDEKMFEKIDSILSRIDDLKQKTLDSINQLKNENNLP